MKKIGMLGGMSWESTSTYYKLLNEEIKNRLGGLHSAKLILSSVDFLRVIVSVMVYLSLVNTIKKAACLLVAAFIMKLT